MFDQCGYYTCRGFQDLVEGGQDIGRVNNSNNV